MEPGSTCAGSRSSGSGDDRIVWGRLYLEDVEVAGADIDKAVEHMARGSE
jgi:hypothetical protein